jgi:peroxiredoxin
MTTASTSIADQVAALNAAMATRAPAEVLAAFAGEQADLNAAGIPSDVATPGTVMPDGDLVDAYGRAVTLESVRDGRGAVIVFYRGAWCPYCNLALRAYQDQLAPALAERNVALVAVSPQTPDGLLTMTETNELTYTVLSDRGNQIAGKLGVLTASNRDAQDAQTAMGFDVAAGNADGTNTVPMPTVVVVDTAGMIAWIDVHPDYTTRSEVAHILAAVDSTIG